MKGWRMAVGSGLAAPIRNAPGERSEPLRTASGASYHPTARVIAAGASQRRAATATSAGVGRAAAGSPS